MSMVECLRFDESLPKSVPWQAKNSITDMYNSRTIPQPHQFYCVGGPTWDLQVIVAEIFFDLFQGNYTPEDDEFLLLQNTFDEGMWWACFFIGKKDDVANHSWDEIYAGDSLSR